MKKLMLIFALLFLYSGVSSLKAQQDGEIFVVVDNQPVFPGGEKALVEFISKNLKYPANSEKSGVQGTVFANFVIETDGSVSNIKILRGLNDECNAEVLRVISMMPKWTPGTQNGKAVRVSFNIPVKFALSSK